jgi:putative sigma-54 modulation protein
MKLILSTHNITLTQAIEDHVLDKLDKLEHLDQWAVDARIILEHDNTKAPERQFNCSCAWVCVEPDLYAQDKRSDLYTAIDYVFKKIEQQIRKRRNKRKATKHTRAARQQKRQDAEI